MKTAPRNGYRNTSPIGHGFKTRPGFFSGGAAQPDRVAELSDDNLNLVERSESQGERRCAGESHRSRQEQGDVDISHWRTDSLVGGRCRSGKGVDIIGRDGGGFCRCPSASSGASAH